MAKRIGFIVLVAIAFGLFGCSKEEAPPVGGPVKTAPGGAETANRPGPRNSPPPDINK